MLHLVLGDNLEYLRTVDDNSIDLIYIDPPFNTGRTREGVRLFTTQDPNGDRNGFQGKRYKTTKQDIANYNDNFNDFLAFLQPRLIEAHRVLSEHGSFFFHIDYREVHYCKIILDQIFGRESFMNEIIWAYDYGGRSKSRWSAKHDNILWYAKSPNHYTFNYEDIDRIPYMAPSLVGKEKAQRGKTPTDVWWNTIVPTNSKERNGYPTQKPLRLLERIVKVHSLPQDKLMDFFAGSGTFGEAAAKNGRKCILVDNNPEAIETMKTRLSGYLFTDQYLNI